MDFNFENFFKYPKLFLSLNRSYPDIPRDKKWCFQFVFMHGLHFCTLIILMYCIIFCDLKNNEFSKACYKGTLLIIAIFVNLYYGVMLKYKAPIIDLIQTMKKDFKSAVTLPKEEKIMLMDYANKGQRVSKLCLVLGVTSGMVFPLKSTGFMIYSIIVNKFKLVPIVDYLTYPCADENTNNEWKSFIVFYVLTLWFFFYSACMYAGFAPLCPIFMSHTCGQLELVKIRAQELFLVHGYQLEETRKKLKYITSQLRHVYSSAQRIEESFQIIHEITLKLASVMIPLTLYQVKETYNNNGHLDTNFLAFFFAMIAVPCLPCYYGDLLIQTSDNVREAIYMSGWEKHWDQSTRSATLILLTQTTQPIAIRSLFRPICLDTLADVFHQAYAIFNLLNATM